MRILVLWTGLPPYLISTLQEMADQGLEIKLLHTKNQNNAPHKKVDLAETFGATNIEILSISKIVQIAKEFNPDLVYVSGWHCKEFKKICRALNSIPRLLFMDNQWRGTIKQYVGVLLRKMLVNRYFDYVVCPGERQKRFANYLGYSLKDIFLGGYYADEKTYNLQVRTKRVRSFLFVGRLEKEKGLDVLLKAYKQYSLEVIDPWELKIVGVGSLREKVTQSIEVSYMGFLEPKAIASLMQQSKFLVLPSLFEPWGVVIHEASLCGTPAIYSSTCGAGEFFSMNSKFMIEPNNVEDLKCKLIEAHELKESEYAEISNFVEKQAHSISASDLVSIFQTLLDV